MRLLIATLCALPLLAPAQEPTIKVDVDLVNIFMSVHDKHGALIGNLEKNDFKVYEDGKEQTIKYFSRETNLPLTLGMLVDVSVSQGNLIDLERSAASAFFYAVVRKQDQAFLISFGADAELLQDLTNSPPLLSRGLNGLQVNSDVGGLHPGPVPTIYNPKGTILYDAVYLASNDKLAGEVGRKALILITDGEDEGSHYSIKEAAAAAQRSDAIIYGIYYVDPGFYNHRGFFGVSDSALRELSDDTGGRVFRVSRKYPLQSVFKEIQDEMRSQYTIGYIPTNAAKDGTFRRLEIRTNNKDFKVQARKGYYAGRS